MDNLENKIKKYYDEQEVPNMDKKVLQKLNFELDKKDKNKRKNFILKLALSICICLIVCLSIILPILLKNNDNKSYYSEQKLVQKNIELDEAMNIINDKLNTLNFIFNDCSINYIYGYYNNNEIYAMSINAEKYDPPFTTFTIDIVFNKKYVYADHNLFITDAEIISNDNYTMYKKIINVDNIENLVVLIDYEDYSLYLQFNINDTELLDKFL